MNSYDNDALHRFISKQQLTARNGTSGGRDEWAECWIAVITGASGLTTEKLVAGQCLPFKCRTPASLLLHDFPLHVHVYDFPRGVYPLVIPITCGIFIGCQGFIWGGDQGMFPPKGPCCASLGWSSSLYRWSWWVFSYQMHIACAVASPCICGIPLLL